MSDFLRSLQKNNFLVLGRAGMDLAASEPGRALEEGGGFTSDMGGSSANIAVGLVQLGARASVGTPVSDDAVGRFIINRMKRYGVDATYVTTVGGDARTSLALYDMGLAQTSTVIYRNDAADFHFSKQDARAIDYTAFGAMIFTGTGLAGQPSRDALLLAMDLAQEAGLPIIMDVDYRPYSWESPEQATRTLAAAAERSSVIVANDEEFAVLAGDAGKGLDKARALVANGADLIVYKMGAEGSITFFEGRESRFGVFPTKLLKPNGAGDSFMAGLMTSLAEGLCLEEAVLRGSACASIVVSRPGCASAMPTRQELEAFLLKRPRPQAA